MEYNRKKKINRSWIVYFYFWKFYSTVKTGKWSTGTYWQQSWARFKAFNL